MIIGFTGTREALSQDQLRWLELALRSSTREVIHHGCCVGADAVIHRLAILYGFQVVLHPPADLRLADTEAIGNARKAIKRGASHCVLMPAKPYLERNRDIVDACDLLIAMPRNARAARWHLVHGGIRRVAGEVDPMLPAVGATAETWQVAR